MSKILPTHPTLVHPRTGEPLRALGWTRRGPIWPVIGASEPPTPPTPPNPPADPPKPPADPPKPPDPGPAGGVEALRAELAGERDKRQASDKLVTDLQAQIKALEPLQKLADALGGGGDGKPPTDIEKITARLDEQDKATVAANLRAIRAEVKALASGWHDPADAVLQLGDLSPYMTKEGTADEAKIKAKLEEVLKAKPYFAKEADNGRRGGARPDPGQGARGGDRPGGAEAGKAEAAKRFGKKPAATT